MIPMQWQAHRKLYLGAIDASSNQRTGDFK
jgi:hypothetical protein